uniref:Uncharacterized protein n=1 Tax=Ixodes ricinus TaxID=34613 RepID=A0A6B0UAR1_IXORI
MLARAVLFLAAVSVLRDRHTRNKGVFTRTSSALYSLFSALAVFCRKPGFTVALSSDGCGLLEWTLHKTLELFVVPRELGVSVPFSCSACAMLTDYLGTPSRWL